MYLDKKHDDELYQIYSTLNEENKQIIAEEVDNLRKYQDDAHSNDPDCLPTLTINDITTQSPEPVYFNPLSISFFFLFLTPL